MPTITPKATYYLVYAALVALTFVVDMTLLKKLDKTSRAIGYILSIILDLGIFGFGIYLLCLLGRYWQNKEIDKKRDHR